MVGDFNLPNIHWDTLENTSGVNEVVFVELLNDHYLSQLINSPTRGNNILDLVITNMPDLVSLTRILPSEETSVFTDHHAITFDFSAFLKQPRRSTRTVYNYARGNVDGLCAALQETDLSSTISESSDNINVDWKQWKETFLSTVSEFVPKTKIRGQNPLPWINGNILHQIKKKESIRRKLRANPSAHLLEKYKKMRSEVKRLLRESRENFFSSINDSFANNPKRFWSVMKHKSKTCSIPDCISMPAPSSSADQVYPSSSARLIAANPGEIAEMFNSYFASVFTSDDLPVTTDKSSTDAQMTELILSKLEVEHALRSLDSNKATGPDEIPARLLKVTAPIIAPSLCKLFNKSLRLGSVPEEWKLANVVPVHKKGDKGQTENYRPISLLSIVSKVLERIVLTNIKYHLTQSINKCQHGFLQGKSCVTNLLEVLDYIGEILDNGGQVDTIYLDMSKAFDRISHRKLINKLKNCGCGGSLLTWFTSYLTGRRQRVTVLGATSNSLPISSGVPQGSILGPVLFLLYVNDLPDSVSTSQVAMFADDTKLFSTIKCQNDAVLLQNDLRYLEYWSSKSGLMFNELKCKQQQITRKIKPITTTYMLNDQQLGTTDTERDLGICVSSNLTWTTQVRQQVSKASKLLGYIRRNTMFVTDISPRRTLYLALVRSHFGYCSQIWAPQNIDLINMLERTQRRATKYILNLPFSTDIDYRTRLRSLQLLPVSSWHEYLDLTLFFKITHGFVESSAPPVIQVTHRATRSSSNNSIKYVIRKCKTTTYQQSFFVRTCRIWNRLIDVLHFNTDSVSVFKSVLLKYYHQSLELNYDPDNPRTFKTICLKCNSVRSLANPLSCCS